MSTIINSVLAVSLALTLGVAASSSLRQQPEKNSGQTPQEIYRKHGLKAAAEAGGGHFATMTDWDSEVTFPDLSTFVTRSAVVLMGDITANESHLSKSGEYITTDYKMLVRHTFKGDIPVQSEVVFQVMGGKVVFEDGSSAVMETKGFIRPNNGARVVIFANPFPADDPLMPADVLRYAAGSPVHRLVGLSRGLVELPDNEDERVKVKALSARDNLSRDTRQKSAKAFLVDLRKAVAHSKGKSPNPPESR